MTTMEFWTLGRTPPLTIAAQAAAAEEDGWDGLLMPDTQSVMGDAYVALALAVPTTQRLRLGTGVTNPFTRHPAVTASAIATLNAVSGGRAVLGIGRGDSSLAHLGLAPASPATLAEYLDRVQTYLRGEAVDFTRSSLGGDRGIETIPGAGHPDESRLAWIDPALPKVPVDVAATGPKVIALAACVADRLTFAVGADAERLAAAIALARSARAEAGLDPADLSFGAYLNVVAHPDHEVARDLAATGVATFSRFSIMHGRPTPGVDDRTSGVLEQLSKSYDLRQHGASDASHRMAVTGEFIDQFGVVGHPETCAQRLLELAEVGIDRIAILQALAAPSDELTRSERLLVEEVFPAIRERSALTVEFRPVEPAR